MEIKLGEKTGKKIPLYADGELIGSLYPKEINTYSLEDECEISESEYERIVEETLLPRAKRYVMNLLVKSDKTEAELKRKLRQAGYGEVVSEGAIEYVRSFHYIDELRTAESFIRTKMDFSSEKEIRYKLSEKGIDEETIDTAYSLVVTENEKYSGYDPAENTELRAAENFVIKKLGTRLSMGTDDENEDILPYEEKQKLMAAAFRKGFRQDSIRQALKNLNVDT